MTVQPTVYKSLKFPAPLLYVLCFVLGIVVQNWVPLRVIPGGLAQLFGFALPGLGIVVMGFAVYQFQDEGTSMLPFRPTVKLVQTGIYHMTRNPLYVGMTLVYAGLGILFNNIWIVGLLLVIIPAMNWGVIGPEERFLEQKFGEAYRRYTYQVRRWI